MLEAGWALLCGLQSDVPLRMSMLLKASCSALASDIGYSVDFVTEATLTFPMTHAGSGVTFSAQDIKTNTKLVLQERFARVVDVDTCLANLAV